MGEIFGIALAGLVAWLIAPVAASSACSVMGAHVARKNIEAQVEINRRNAAKDS